VDRIFHYGEEGRRAILEEAQDEARERAVAAGADPGAVQIIEVEEIPLAYLTTPAARSGSRRPGLLAAKGSTHNGGIHEAPPRMLAAAATVPILTLLAACSGSSSPPSASSQSQPANAVFTYDTTAR